MSNEEKKLNTEGAEEEIKKEDIPSDNQDAAAPEDEEKEMNASEEKEEDSQKTAEEPKKEESADEEAMDAKYLRLMADFQNYKRRAEKEKSEIYAYANEKLAVQLLDVIDNFERALQHETADENYIEGMKMIFKQLTGVLEKAGLEEINALGEDFDPNFHNAVMTEDNADYESGKVTEVMQKGYLLNKKVIRPSMVKVNN
ncbi:MAG: nucleotide exchange factor GrpE [Anaerovoracaceae bacterium]